jgi:ATP-dependent DNA ligase
MLWRRPSHARHRHFVEPCPPTLGSAVPSGPKWAYEIKHACFRFNCRRDGDRVRVFSERRPEAQQVAACDSEIVS